MAKPGHDIDSILDILSGNKLYHVPKYQRGYSWTEENIKDLWDDIVQSCLKGRDLFMGTLILAKKEQDGVEEYEIIDGQQRLVTFTILFRVFYDLLASEKNSERFRRQLYSHIAVSANTYRLTLGEEDESFFERVIKRPVLEGLKGRKTSHKRIKTAYELLLQNVTNYLGASGFGTASELIDVIDESLRLHTQFLVITVGSDFDGYTIFESINAKRVDLTPAELIKNYFFMVASSSADDLSLVEQAWGDMAEALSAQRNKEISVTEFMRHYWISAVGDVREKDLYRTLKEDVVASVSRVTNLMNVLPAEAINYSMLINPDLGDNYSHKFRFEGMKKLNRFGFRQAYPFLLSITRRATNQEELDSTIDMLESIILRRSVVGSNPNELEELLSRYAREINQNGLACLDKLKEEVRAKLPSNEQVSSLIVSGSETPNSITILEEFERDCTNGEKVPASKTLEHIMPQTPKDLRDWGVSHEEYIYWVGNLGNLTLLGQSLNSSIKNSAFRLKKDKYKDSEYVITKKLTEYNEWGLDQIHQRAKEIAEFINRRWPNLA